MVPDRVDGERVSRPSAGRSSSRRGRPRPSATSRRACPLPRDAGHPGQRILGDELEHLEDLAPRVVEPRHGGWRSGASSGMPPRHDPLVENEALKAALHQLACTVESSAAQSLNARPPGADQLHDQDDVGRLGARALRSHHHEAVAAVLAAVVREVHVHHAGHVGDRRGRGFLGAVPFGCSGSRTPVLLRPAGSGVCHQAEGLPIAGLPSPACSDFSFDVSFAAIGPPDRTSTEIPARAGKRGFLKCPGPAGGADDPSMTMSFSTGPSSASVSASRSATLRSRWRTAAPERSGCATAWFPAVRWRASAPSTARAGRASSIVAAAPPRPAAGAGGVGPRRRGERATSPSTRNHRAKDMAGTMQRPRGGSASRGTSARWAISRVLGSRGRSACRIANFPTLRPTTSTPVSIAERKWKPTSTRDSASPVRPG